VDLGPSPRRFSRAGLVGQGARVGWSEEAREHQSKDSMPCVRQQNNSELKNIFNSVIVPRQEVALGSYSFSKSAGTGPARKSMNFRRRQMDSIAGCVRVNDMCE
jgi:hypothetical protein